VAWVIRPEQAYPQQVSLFDENEIGNLSATRRLYAPESAPTAKDLRTLIWEPLEPFLDGVTSIYFAPAGILHQINLGAIPVSATEILADRFKLHRLVSTRQILEKSRASSDIPTTALVFGGIRYESDSLALSTTNLISKNNESESIATRNRGALGDDWHFLDGSLKEAISIRKRLERAGAKVNFAEGFAASEGLFKTVTQQAPSPGLLHLATHGFFLTALDSTAQSGFSSAKNPMVRAGLIMSGANRVWNGAAPLIGQEDGILTALEISYLDLSGTTLAVLSACGTGQGAIEAGEGVLGLQRAFKMAGAHYVIMTLWNVQDHDAQQFMDYFYEAWLNQKQDIPEAFRRAQKQMRESHTKPFQPSAWAGFILLE
jgi:CHAT domain-containing protein